MYTFIASYFDVYYSKGGQSKGEKELTLEQKAKSFAAQYLRILMNSKLQFFLCKVKAADFNILTIHQWESEMFRQIDKLLKDNGMVQELPDTSQSVTDEMNALERIHSSNDDSNDDEEDGAFFTFYPNMDRTEVRVYATHNEESNERVSLLEEIKNIIKNICKKENPEFPLYHEMLAKKESDKVSANTSSNTKNMLSYFKTISKECYKHGYSQRGTINSQGIGGGGNLPLNKDGVFKLGTVLYDCIPKTWSQHRRQLRIYWIGCGFGEEILVICRLAQKFKYPLFIHATDIEEELMTIFQAQVDRLGLSSMVRINKTDVYTTTAIDETFDIVYTSAAIGLVFVLKLLTLALTCSTVQYVLCNHTHCVFLEETRSLPSQFRAMARARLIIVDAHLEAEKSNEKGEERWIYALDISRYAF